MKNRSQKKLYVMLVGFVIINVFMVSGCTDYHLSWRRFLEDAESNKPQLAEPQPSEPQLRSKRSYVQVESVVTAYNDRHFTKILEKRPPLNFVEIESEDIRVRSENQRIVSSCAHGAAYHDFQVTIAKTDCPGCIDVLVNHKFLNKVEKGTPQESCISFWLFGTRQTRCSSYTPIYSTNNRWVSMTFIDHNSREQVHQIDVFSTGETPSVLAVAKEMCFAGLERWPGALENENLTATLGLEYEAEVWRRNRPKRTPAVAPNANHPKVQSP